MQSVHRIALVLLLAFAVSIGGTGSAQETEESERAVTREKIEVREAGAPQSGAGQDQDETRLAAADAGGLPVIPGGMEGVISLDLRNIEIVDALKFVAERARINVISTKNVTGRLSLTVQNVRIKDVFDIMLRSNGLAYSKTGDIYNVMTDDEFKAIYGKKFADVRQVKVFRLQYAIPDQAFTLLDTLKSDVGRVLVEPDSGTALVMDTPENIKEIDKAISSLEQKNSVKVFTLKYSKAKEIEEQLKTQLDSKKVGMIKADERSNQVIVQTLPERMADIERLIASLDKKTKVVLIDTQIVKIKLSDALTSGVNWEGIFNMNLPEKLGMAYAGSYPFSVLQESTNAWMSRNDFLKAQGGQVGAIPFSGNTSSVNASTKNAPGQNMHVGIVNDDMDFDVLVNFLQTLGKTQVLSSPKLSVINNQEAKIHVGERQAYVTTTTTSGQTTTTVSEEVTFVDVGIQLSVTPTINDEGDVTMKIKPEVSTVVSTLITPSGNKIPILDTSMAETTVMVKDNSTIIIGGLRKEEKISSSNGVPILNRIPILGTFFKSETSSKERTELMVLITPHIVKGDTLFTGDEREFGVKPVKEYKDYPALTSETDYQSPQAAPEETIKPYVEYKSIHEIEKPELTIKGAGDDE